MSSLLLLLLSLVMTTTTTTMKTMTTETMKIENENGLEVIYYYRVELARSGELVEISRGRSEEVGR